jgi:hypothetical protein
MSRFDNHLAFVSVVVGLLASVPTFAGGQSPDAISANTRVRIDLSTTERSRFGRERAQSVVGTLEAVRGDTLLLIVRPDAAPLRIPRGAMRTVYVSDGHPARWRAALNGALLPALIAGMLSAAGASIHPKQGDPSPAQMAASSAAWAGASGALLGAWSPKERWRAVPRLDSITNHTPSPRER